MLRDLNLLRTIVMNGERFGSTSLLPVDRHSNEPPLESGIMKEGLPENRREATSTSCSPTTTITSTPGSCYGRQQLLCSISPTEFTDMESSKAAFRHDPVGLDNAMPPKKICSNDIPVLDSFHGYYGFDLYRPLCGDAYEATETKPSTAFFYFKDEQGWTNLFSKKTPTWWTLCYWCRRQPPEGCFIRLTPVYGTSDKQQEVIQRCFEDFMEMPTNSLARYSIVIVGNSLADYFFDPITERLCVTLPYERPKEGCEYSQFNGKFMCFNSCLYNGGQGNKKPLFLLITLERLVTGTEPSKGHCEVLGRQCIKFRSCACPKRDKENSERRTGEAVYSLHLQSIVKRRKDSDRVDRQNRKRSSDHGTNGSSKGVRQCASGRLTSPSHHLLGHDMNLTGLNETGMELVRNPMFISESDASQMSELNSITCNGEAYHLIAVPANLPGGLETLSGVRSGLLRTWMHWGAGETRLLPTEGYNTDCIKPEVGENGKSVSVESGNGEERDGRRSMGSRPSTDAVLSQLTSIEAQIVQLVDYFYPSPVVMATVPRRERARLPGNCYQYSGNSTDSQPNSSGGIGLSLSSTEETGTNAGTLHDYSSTNPVGPLSTDSGIYTEMMHLRGAVGQHQQQQVQQQQQQQQPSLAINRMFSVPTSVNRQSSGYTSASVRTAPLNTYDLDYVVRFQNMGQDNHETNTNVSSATSPATPATLPSLIGSRATVNRISLPETATQQIPSINSSLNHVLTTTAFYTPPYFSGRVCQQTDLLQQQQPQPTSQQQQQQLQLDQAIVAAQLDSFSRTHLQSINSAVNAASGTPPPSACFYQSAMGGSVAPGLTDHVLASEEALNNYLDREKIFEDNTECAQLNKRQSVR